MKYGWWPACVILLLPLPACTPDKQAPGGDVGAADLVFRRAAVYTMDAARSWASAVGVRDGRIVYVGSDSLPPGLIGSHTEVVDLRGKMVLPGFQDGHVHPISSGIDLGECSLDDLATAATVSDSIRACARTHPEQTWIRGGGWQLPLFKDANPLATLLDQVVPDRPAIFYAADGHS